MPLANFFQKLYLPFPHIARIQNLSSVERCAIFFMSFIMQNNPRSLLKRCLYPSP